MYGSSASSISIMTSSRSYKPLSFETSGRLQEYASPTVKKTGYGSDLKLGGSALIIVISIVSILSVDYTVLAASNDSIVRV